ncbi:unnamed protein product [Cylindrotheca closterium]|uniref:Uncharacterized protein n=1 Tax=Cylindrotheca closterium TaxID=2856 RepID=A0AAD2G558_9STRA|nr:unnamed protein product [Cylindrotheca closterium]
MLRRQHGKLIPNDCKGVRRNAFIILLFFTLIPTLCHSFSSNVLPTISPSSSLSSNTNNDEINPKLVIRRIKSKPKNVEHALHILESNGHHPIVVVEALKVCGNCQEHDLALKVFQQYPSEPARTMTIFVLGSSQAHYQKALDLLDDKDVTSPSYNAAIAACGRAKDWERALEIHDGQIPKDQRTTLTTNALMTILAQCRKGAQALQVLQDFDDEVDVNKDGDHQRRPSRVTYQTAIYAMVRSQMEKEAFEVLEDFVQKESSSPYKSQQLPTDAMFDMLTAAFHKRSNWEYIRKVEQLRHPERSIELSEVQNKYAFQHWDKLERVGIGKKSYFVLGQVSMPQSGSASQQPLNITIGVLPHRNPGKNGIQLEFHENHPSSSNETASAASPDRTKLGFLLMQNSATDNTSTMLGMFLTPASRGKGISKACMAVWLSFCLQANIRPKTGIINKPLLALALQHTFGFRPEKGSIDIELVSPSAVPESQREQAQASSSSSAPPLWIYANSRKTIESVFSAWDIQNQNISVLTEPPQRPLESRRIVSMRTAFETPDDLEELQKTIDKILPKASISSHLEGQDIRRVYLGKE